MPDDRAKFLSFVKFEHGLVQKSKLIDTAPPNFFVNHRLQFLPFIIRIKFTKASQCEPCILGQVANSDGTDCGK